MNNQADLRTNTKPEQFSFRFAFVQRFAFLFMLCESYCKMAFDKRWYSLLIYFQGEALFGVGELRA